MSEQPAENEAPTRWLVERTRDVFEDVGAHGLTVLTSGALWFTDADDDMTLCYAPGQWISVVPEES